METFNITPIENEGKRVLTTAQLAEAYETDSKTIRKNFERNKERYMDGKHFYYLTGETLKAFKNTTRLIDVLPKNINTLYLWTEKGALLQLFGFILFQKFCY
ncbi:MAG: ORF6N domain-containing protein [Oscillospiraceae bacterium]|nr:ORF6N domain-containing protein [Oscillospiraceae bacterium]